MIVKQFRTHFKNELSEVYPTTEIDSFFFLLIDEYLGLQRIDTVLKPDFKIDEAKLSILNKALQRLKNQEPLQYIIGKTEFYGYPFFVDKNTLIPRPETEELVEWILNEIENLDLSENKKLNILDIGTGSGCIPISLAKNLKNTTISSIDVSADALKMAKKNAELNKVNINFIENDILATNNLPESYDIIVSNPPYVRELEKVEIQNNVLENEPHLALFVSDDDPLIFYNKIAELAKKHLSKSGILFFEINQYLGKETLEMLIKKGFKNVELRKDLFKNDRMIKANI
ncbi:protein-(glutamine-N5) methyltransferase, release factor-specific [Polaribacter reichenbachii]|uniref:Release factor glutamine methyltransferase n=1 Tax=Polaribacter reichenbachii TaxID=996801 RepID=A0A1B8U5S2_9FLAO|nr:peptide chain release factor N(5)-glutamine methyltransferase [Polaribacter reichenbachii]APZ47839.1 protein-(glutamine-N5) methyltransferase, release factor-specific [Polaribacter reichenbachii]AUC18474.1 protein-(glutamine-N5) methyltransferase, release factor-specific [Polaribacter reichenbachii]OBY67213.1 protein-(glutamine-N5) methyltransferase, release factor-specific [Polaribacter reichenbachii]